MREKLITLFKQCCDNPKFNKRTAPSDEFIGGLTFKTPEDFKVPDNVLELLKNCRLNLTGFNSNIDNHQEKTGYCSNLPIRKFEFDSEPPLLLIPVELKLNTSFDRACISFGDVFSEKSNKLKTEYYKEKNFWGVWKSKSREVPETYLRRNVTINADASNHIGSINETINSEVYVYPYVYRNGYYLLDSEYMMVTLDGGSVYDNEKIKDQWGKYKTIYMSESSFIDDNDLFNHISNIDIRLRGVILKFGEVWFWYSYDEYKELEAYYTNSILKTHEVVLNQRIEETKG